ncbi:putative riboflavin biosynthesis protein Rib7 [Talaromyces proteolyticus]|uniref:2,5-diamino-6-ribosylamino-4(3H)-pyrimidinone 5'-phosphate reductase n=1 Tax=Talaromyces proteolyticus TaxID=1131652 RepID=A0AAD4PZR2_9EURO|nr:putative riboflavin biosynthesis protein Rib7 [Talaromyces proteolyticus]KAH8703278.1 putative riboflavin biosynthesis protein Rib7 [Talaromyces proteolyticus]
MAASFPSDALHFPANSRPFLEPYLPPEASEDGQIEAEKGEAQQEKNGNDSSRPYTTLTFATSLDSALSLAPGMRTVLSGPQSKAMTHYLRSRHQAILIGVGTANADDPGLNCRIEGVDGYKLSTVESNLQPDAAISDYAKKASSDPELRNLMKNVAMGRASTEQMQGFQSHLTQIQNTKHEENLEKLRREQEKLQQPRPIVIDPRARWGFHEGSKILSLVREGKGKAPFIIISKNVLPPKDKQELLEAYGGKFIAVETVQDVNGDTRFDWNTILRILATEENIKSIMIEGGGAIINSILSEPRYSALVDSVIITIAPKWLGQGGVVVSPKRLVDEDGCAIPASRLTEVQWHPFGEDVVLCGRIIKSQ